MDIQPDRLALDFESIAACSNAPPGTGFSRPTFSAAWAAACDYVIEQAARAGCRHRRDAHGNIHVRRAATAWTAPRWLCGSHLDSVPTGGKYDGVTGVVVALELLRCGADIELIVFAEEEGTTFGLGMLGSRSWVGALTPKALGEVRNADGQSYLEAGAAFGVRPDAMARDRLNPAHYLGFIEVHPEQGLSLWNRNIRLALVDRINGRRQYRVTVLGQCNHAGSTRMSERRDALAGAAEMALEVERIGRALAERLDYTVLTVGRFDPRPNALNVIAGEVVLTIDFRAQTEEALTKGDATLRARFADIAAARGLEVRIELTEEQPPVPMDAGLVQRIQRAAPSLGLDLARVPSGALHDAAILAPVVPTAMLFVASRDGISHHPDEFSRVDDIACAARLVAAVAEASHAGPTASRLPGGTTRAPDQALPKHRNRDCE